MILRTSSSDQVPWLSRNAPTITTPAGSSRKSVAKARNGTTPSHASGTRRQAGSRSGSAADAGPSAVSSACGCADTVSGSAENHRLPVVLHHGLRLVGLGRVRELD